MNRKILLAIDGSACSLRASEFAGDQLSGISGLEITLLHVLPYPPAPLWDDGHILTAEERMDRRQAAEKWFSDQRAKAEPIFDSAIAILGDRGIKREQITKTMISDSSDTADSIIEEARDGKFQMLVIGRCGHQTVKEMFMGSVTSKIVKNGAGIAICIVE